MAIKIDLLPEYVPLRRKLKWTVTSAVVTLGVTASVLALIYQNQVLELQAVEEDVQNIKVIADASRAAASKAAEAQKAAAPMQTAVDFIAGATKTGPQRAALLYQVHQYVHPAALISSLDISDGKTVKIQATVKDTDQYAAFLLQLRRGSTEYNGPLFAKLPTADGIPGFPKGASVFVPPLPDPNGQPVVMVFPFQIRAEGELRNPVTLPADPVPDATPAPQQ